MTSIERYEERQQTRQRAEHTRSRMGCKTCRSRHIRCDERRPSCHKCVVSGRLCHYDTAGAPLRDRRMQRVALLPGEQQPWQMGSMIKSLDSLAKQETALDPLQCLPIDLPYKSRQLLKHFLEVYDTQKNEPPEALNVVALAEEDPASFRSIFLVAACHFCFHTGSLQYFKATYHHQMSECFRLTKEKWLLKRRPNLRFLNFIAFMCVAEAFTNNISSAEAHLDGLFKLIDMPDSISSPVFDEQDIKDEASLEQHARLTHNFCTAVVARLPQVRLATMRQFGNTHWLINTLAESFSIINLLPFFSSWKGHHIVDPARSVSALREVTAYLAPRMPLSYHPIAEGVEMRLYVAITRAVPLPPDGTEVLLDVDYEVGYIPKRSAFVAACGFYVCNTVGISWRPEALYHSVFRKQSIKLLKEDIEQTQGALRTTGLVRDFWLWKVFVVAVAIVNMEGQSKVGSPDSTVSDDNRLSELKVWFFACIRLWTVASGVTEWLGAKETLSRVVWLDRGPVEALAAEVWMEAVGG